MNGRSNTAQIKSWYKEYCEKVGDDRDLDIGTEDEFEISNVQHILIEEYKLRCNDFRAEYSQYCQLWTVFLSVIGLLMGLSFEYENGKLNPTSFILSVPYFIAVFLCFLTFRRKTSIQLQKYIQFLESKINRVLLENEGKAILFWFWLIREKYKQGIEDRGPGSQAVWGMVVPLVVVCLLLFVIAVRYAYRILPDGPYESIYIIILGVLMLIPLWLQFILKDDLPLDQIYTP